MKSLGYEEVLKIIEALPKSERLLSHDNIIEESKELLKEFIPEWNVADLAITRCTDGITNKLLKATNTQTNEAVLIRCYGHGTSVIIDRKNELISIVTLASLKYAPPIIGRFENGFCYGYVEGKVLSPDDLMNVDISALIAKKLAMFHKVKMPIPNDATPGKTMLWETMRRWLKKVPSKFPPGKQAKIVKYPFLRVEQIASELDSLQADIETTTKSPVVFCHNDLLSANLIYQPDEIVANGSSEFHSIPGESSNIVFIDFEYGSYSYRDFDIANHFNEFAGFDCDYSKYPSKEFQLSWLGHYLSQSNGSSPDDELLSETLKSVNKFALVSHFFWGIWALVQASISDIEFDYIEYAALRIGQYHKLKG